MTLTNTRNAYGWLSICLHWISAIGVIWLYFLGEDIEHGRKDNLSNDEMVVLVRFHVSVGLCFFLFLAARIITHLTQVRPEPLADQKYLNLISLFVQRLWLLMIGIQIITGPLVIWTAGRAMKFFDYFEIPSPLPRMEALHEVLEFVHATAPNLFWPLLALHLLGAAKHLFWNRDRTVQRMLWVRGT